MTKKQSFLKIILIMIKEFKNAENKDKIMFNYRKLISVLMRASEKPLDQKGRVDFEKDFELLNDIYCEVSFQLDISFIKDWVITQFLFVCRTYHHLQSFIHEKAKVPSSKIEKKLCSLLKLIFLLYSRARASGLTLTKEFIILLEDIEEGNEDFKILAFEFTSSILFNDSFCDNKNISTTFEEKEGLIKKLLKIGPANKYSMGKFMSSICVLIQKYAVSFFSVKDVDTLFHVTTFNSFKSLQESNEIWAKKTSFLNDKEDQKSFSHILNDTNMSWDLTESKNDINNDYGSLSLTNEYPLTQIINKYGGSSDNALVLEFSKLNTKSLITIFSSGHIFNGKLYVFLVESPIMGKVSYNYEETKNNWIRAVAFVKSLNCTEENETRYIKKAANVFKLFYKDKKWSYEKEIRLAFRSPEVINFLNYSESEEFWKFKGQTWTFFSSVYLQNDKNENNLVNILHKDPVSKESFEFMEENFLHFNLNENKSSFYDIIRIKKSK